MGRLERTSAVAPRLIDRAIRAGARVLRRLRGRCALCGCTEERACVGPGGVPCGWVDETRTLCTACAAEIDHGQKSKP